MARRAIRTSKEDSMETQSICWGTPSVARICTDNDMDSRTFTLREFYHRHDFDLSLSASAIMFTSKRKALVPAVGKSYSRIKKWEYLTIYTMPCVITGGERYRQREALRQASLRIGWKISLLLAAIYFHMGQS